MRKIVVWTWEDREKTIEYYSDIFDLSDAEEAVTHPDLVCGEGRLAIPGGGNTDTLKYVVEHLTVVEPTFDEDDW